MDVRSVRLKYVRAPDIKDLETAQYFTSRTSTYLRSATPLDLEANLSWITTKPLNSGRFKILRGDLFHRLSYFAEEQKEFSSPTRCSDQEYALLTKFPNGFFNKAFSSKETLTKCLAGLEKVVVSNPKGFRLRDVRTTGNMSLETVLYPPSECIGDALAQILIVSSNVMREDPLLGAIIIWCMILTIHPFEDGNGRVSRIVFNGLVRDNITEYAFIPLYELARMSRKGLLFSMREARYFGDWLPLCRWMEKAALQILSFHSRY